MGTLVCFHAHPDDESISTGGTIARAVAEGHRVVLVVATNGDHGEVPDDLAWVPVPGMILQPLVENSVKYAVAVSKSPVTIVIAAGMPFGTSGSTNLLRIAQID